MYKRILVTLDASPCDRTIIDHIKALAKLCGSSVTLLHVADGWAARRFGKDAVSSEISDDTNYLKKVKAELEAAGIPTTAELAYGEPRDQIVKWIKEKNLRSFGDVHPRPPHAGRPGLRDHGPPRPASRKHPRVADPQTARQLLTWTAKFPIGFGTWPLSIQTPPPRRKTPTAQK